jgi:hypothetical protein
VTVAEAPYAPTYTRTVHGFRAQPVTLTDTDSPVTSNTPAGESSDTHGT